MGTTSSTALPRRSRPLALAIAVTAAAVLAGGLAAVTAKPGRASEPGPFWALVGGVYLEPHPPRGVDEIAGRADAIVLAHVTGVLDAGQEPGFEDATPAEDGTPFPHSCYVQLTVDEVVKGAVTAHQVLNLAMHTPPAPLGLAAARDSLPQEQFLFFLHDSAPPAQGRVIDAPPLGEQGLWAPLGSRGVIGAGQDGLVLSMRLHEPDATFLRSFGTTTLEGAARRAGQAVR